MHLRIWSTQSGSIAPQDTAFPDWDGLFDVIAFGGEEHQQTSTDLHPPIEEWRWQNGNGEQPR